MSSLNESIGSVLFLAVVVVVGLPNPLVWLGPIIAIFFSRGRWWLVPLVGFACGLALDFGRARIHGEPVMHIYTAAGLAVGLLVGIFAGMIRKAMPSKPISSPPESPVEKKSR